MESITPVLIGLGWRGGKVAQRAEGEEQKKYTQRKRGEGRALGFKGDQGRQAKFKRNEHQSKQHKGKPETPTQPEGIPQGYTQQEGGAAPQQRHATDRLA
jgi:hypothetical protein